MLSGKNKNIEKHLLLKGALPKTLCDDDNNNHGLISLRSETKNPPSFKHIFSPSSEENTSFLCLFL